MTAHSFHPEIHTHGLADECERCQELAEHPEKLLDQVNRARLLYGGAITLLDIDAARRLRAALREGAQVSTRYYDLAGNPISFDDWVRAFEGPRQIGDTTVGEVRVSTVWLGLDHNFFSSGPPLIFETMVFGGPHDEWCDRYSTEDEARAGHERVVAALRNGQAPND